MSLQAIVFDFDGVIANSEPLHFRAYRDVLEIEGVRLAEADYYSRYLGYDDVGAFRAIGADYAGGFSAERVATLVSRKAVCMEALEREGSVLFPGAADVIKNAASAVPIAIASGALGAEIRRVLDREDLSRCFSAIVAADDTPRSKPAPDPYLRVLAQLEAVVGHPFAPRRCVAIEDSRWGLESANAAGLRTVGVAQTYPASALTTADLVIASLDRLDLQTLTLLCSA